jgi:hypothetical protein
MENFRWGLPVALSAGGGGRSFSGCFASVACRFWMWQCRDATRAPRWRPGPVAAKAGTGSLSLQPRSIPYGRFRATAPGATVSRYVRQGQAPGRCARCHARRLRDKAMCFREGAARGPSKCRLRDVASSYRQSCAPCQMDRISATSSLSLYTMT